jgi:hypothetical protein
LSVALAVEIETARLDHVIADVLVTPFFACDRPLRGPAARADWRLCGRLSDHVQRGELTGEQGEAALLPTGGRMRAPLLLAMGLGPRSDFGEETLREVAGSATEKLLGLHSRIAGIALPGEAVSRLDIHRAAGLVLEGVTGALSKRPSALRLRLVVTPEEAGRARAALLETASRLSSTELAIRLERSPGARPHRRTASTPQPESPTAKPALRVKSLPLQPIDSLEPPVSRR